MANGPTRVTDWLQIIQSEFLEMPGLHLTQQQARRLWGLDEITCDAILDALVAAKFLRRTNHDTFLRADGGR